MTVDEAKRRVKEIEAERRKLADERDALEREIHKVGQEKEDELRKAMIGRCYCRKNKRTSFCDETYSDVIAFRVNKISNIYNCINCLCVLDSDYGVYYLGKRVIDPFHSAIKMMMTPDDCPKVIDRFEEISEEEFNAMCNDVFKKLMEKENNNESKN